MEIILWDIELWTKENPCQIYVMGLGEALRKEPE